MFTFHIQDNAERGEDATIDCPVCGSRSVVAATHRRTEAVRVAYLIPAFKLRETYVVRGACGKAVRCLAPLERVSGGDAANVTPLLRYRSSAGAKGFAVLALLTSVVPGFGLLMASIAAYLTRGTLGWPNPINTLSVAISVTVTGCVIWVEVLGLQ